MAGGLVGGLASRSKRLAPNERRFLLGAMVVTAALALSGAASGKEVQALDGKAVVVVTPKPSASRGWLAVSSLAGDAKRPLTPSLAAGERRYDFSPSWSPDGTRVAFARWTPSELALMVVNEDGSGLHRVAGFGRRKAGEATYVIRWITWSPNGAKLALLTDWSRPTQAIYVASATASSAHRVAAAPWKRGGPFGYLSLFGWSGDSSRVIYSFTKGEAISFHYTGPAWLKTVSADGSGRQTVLRDDAINDASWAADRSLIYVRHCAMRACQLAVRDPGAARSRALTHFSLPSGFAEWDELDFLGRPESGDVVYTHGRNVYDLAPSTETTRRIVTLPCPFRRCSEWDNVDQALSLVGITQDGRFALIEYDNWARNPDFISRDYSLDLETGALAHLQLITADPAAVFLR